MNLGVFRSGGDLFFVLEDTLTGLEDWVRLNMRNKELLLGLA